MWDQDVARRLGCHPDSCRGSRKRWMNLSCNYTEESKGLGAGLDRGPDVCVCVSVCGCVGWDGVGCHRQAVTRRFPECLAKTTKWIMVPFIEACDTELERV